MSALHKTIDETLAAIREEQALQMKECSDRVFAAEMKATLLEDQLAKAIDARTFAERLTTRLLTQFAVVEQVFADAKAMAVAAEAEAGQTGVRTEPDHPADWQQDKAETFLMKPTPGVDLDNLPQS